MDVDQRAPRLEKSQKSHRGKKKKEGPLKVVYISSPMKVKTSASRFRSLVQQLTGKNSDISRYMEDNNSYGDGDFQSIDCEDDGRLSAKEAVSADWDRVFSSISSEDTTTTTTTTTTTSSDYSLGLVDSMFASQMEEQFAGIFGSSSFFDASQLDVLGSYDELM